MKPFFVTLSLTLCAALLVGGLLWADVQTRQITFEDKAPPYTHLDSTAFSLPLPATGEALRGVFRSEKAVIRFLWEKYENIT